MKKIIFSLCILASILFLTLDTNSFVSVAYAKPIAYAIADSWRIPLDGDWTPMWQDFNGSYNTAWQGYHLGQDIGRVNQDPVYAAANGRVKFAGSSSGYRYVALIEHTLPDGSQYVSLYGHLQAYGLTSYERDIYKGELIGYLNPDDNHLHFAIREGPFTWAQSSCGGSSLWLYVGYSRPAGEQNRNNLCYDYHPDRWRNGRDFVNAHSGGGQICYDLYYSASGGYINRSPGWNCSDGSQRYASGTNVQLEVVPYSGYSFSYWSGDVSGSSNPTTITMNGNKSVTANFTTNQNPPSPPTLSNPANGANLPYNYDLNFQWYLSSGATEYQVEWWGGPYSTMQPCGWSSSTNCAIGQVATGNTYYWHVRARNSTGTSGWSETWSFYIQNAPVPIPTAPSNLRVTGTTQSSVTIEWNDNSNNESGFNIYKWNGSSWTYLSSVGANVISFTDTSVSCAGTYFYDVSAYNGSGESATTGWVQGNTNSCVSIPQPPTLSSPGNGSSNPYNYNLMFNWYSSSGATEYQIEWWGGPYSTMQPCGWSTSTNCAIGQVATGNTYYWHVRARNSAGTSGWSDTWSFYIQNACSPNVTVTSYPSSISPNETVTVQWNVSGSNCSSVSHTNIHWDTVSHAGQNQDTYAVYTTQQSGGLGTYSDGFTAPSSGTVYFIIHTTVDGNTILTGERSMVISLPTVPHDDFNSARVIGSMPYSDNVDTANATKASDDPIFTCVSRTGSASVWYRYTPSANGRLGVNTIGSNYDTLLAVWRGTRGNLTSIACDDDSGGNAVSSLQAEVLAGVTYYIEVARYADPGTGGMLSLSMAFSPTAGGNNNLFLPFIRR